MKFDVPPSAELEYSSEAGAVGEPLQVRIDQIHQTLPGNAITFARPIQQAGDFFGFDIKSLA